MRRPIARCPDHVPDTMTLAAATWLASGIVLLGLTPLPLHDAAWGWSPAFWLLAAPALLLVAKALCTGQAAFHEASYGRRERSRIASRRSAASGAYTPVREHGGHRRRANRRLNRQGLTI